MNHRTKTMSLLAACRPAYFDKQGEMHRRQSDLRRAISASVSPSRIVALNFGRAVRGSGRS
jgi:hypothetical protein